MEISYIFFNSIQNNNILGFLIAFLAGIISSFSPCSLTSLPLIIGYIGIGDDIKDNSLQNKKNKYYKNIKYSIFFSIGIILTFTLFGIISALFGKRINFFGQYWYMFLGVILTIFALQLFDVFNTKGICRLPKLRKNALGAFFLGILGGFFKSPCSTPILIVILSLVAKGGNVTYGILLMLFYSIGTTILVIISGISADTLTILITSKKYIKISYICKKVLGIFILVFALYMFYLAF